MAGSVQPIAPNRATARGAVRAGGRPAPVTRLLTTLDLPLRTVAEALAIPERSMHRLKQAAVVPAAVADKIARTHDVFKLATEVLGARAAARQWLTRSNPALAGRAPLSLLDTSLGWERVKQVLGRIEHGVPG